MMSFWEESPITKYAARMRRFARFLATAPPTFRLATKATRPGSRRAGAEITVSPPKWRRRPSEYKRSKSERPLSVETLRGNPLSAFGTTATQGCASGTSPHLVTEAMLAFAASHIRLVGTFHGVSQRGEVRARLRTPTNLVKVRMTRRGRSCPFPVKAREEFP